MDGNGNTMCDLNQHCSLSSLIHFADLSQASNSGPSLKHSWITCRRRPNTNCFSKSTPTNGPQMVWSLCWISHVTRLLLPAFCSRTWFKNKAQIFPSWPRNVQIWSSPKSCFGLHRLGGVQPSKSPTSVEWTIPHIVLETIQAFVFVHVTTYLIISRNLMKIVLIVDLNSAVTICSDFSGGIDGFRSKSAVSWVMRLILWPPAII